MNDICEIWSNSHGEVPQPSERSRERNASDLQPGKAMRKTTLKTRLR
jgi:hypothetical protein